MITVSFRTTLQNSVNLGRLYSLHPGCGCSVLIPSGARVVFQEKLETQAIVANLGLLNSFLNRWRTPSNNGLRIKKHTIVVDQHGTPSHPDHMVVKIYNRATWIRNERSIPGKTPYYVRPAVSIFRIYPLNNDLSQGIDRFVEQAPKAAVERSYALHEKALAQSLLNYRGEWCFHRPDRLDSRKGTAERFFFWELKNQYMLSIPGDPPSKKMGANASSGLGVFRFESRIAAARYIAPKASTADHIALSNAIVEPVDEESLVQAKLEMSGIPKTKPNTVKRTIGQYISHPRKPNMRVTPPKGTVPSQGLRNEKKASKARPVSEETSQLNQSITPPVSEDMSHLPSRNFAETFNGSKAISTPHERYEDVETAVVKRYARQFESMFAEMEKDVQIISLEKRLAELQEELKQYQSNKFDKSHQSSESLSHSKLEITSKAMEMMAHTGKNILAEKLSKLEHNKVYTPNQTIHNNNFGYPSSQSATHGSVKAHSALNSSAATNKGSSKPENINTSEQATMPSQGGDLESEMILVPVVRSRAQKEASQKRVQAMQEELLRIAGEKGENIQIRSVDVPEYVLVDASEEKQELLKPLAKGSSQNETSSNTTWGNTFSAAPNQPATSPPVTVPKPSVQTETKKEISRPWLLSWLAGAVPVQKQKNDQPEPELSR